MEALALKGMAIMHCSQALMYKMVLLDHITWLLPLMYVMPNIARNLAGIKLVQK